MIHARKAWPMRPRVRNKARPFVHVLVHRRRAQETRKGRTLFIRLPYGKFMWEVWRG